MKIWGSIIVAFTVLVGAVVALVPSNQDTASAASNPPSSSEVKIYYKDNYQIDSQKQINDASKFTNYQPIKFQDSTTTSGYYYDGFGAIVGTQAIYGLQLVGTTQQKYSHKPAGLYDPAENWAFVNYIEPLAPSTATPIDYEQLFAAKTNSFIIPQITAEDTASRTSTFKFNYEKPGIYRVQIYTREGESGPIGLNTFIVIAKVLDAKFDPAFFTESNSDSMSKPRVISSWMDQETLDGDKQFAILTFTGRLGYSNVRIIKNAISGKYADVTRLGHSGSVNEIAISDPVYNDALKRDAVSVYFVKNKNVALDTYFINFTVEYTMPAKVDSHGVSVITVDPDTGFEIVETIGTYEVLAQIEFVSPPAGDKFPWKTILICIGIMATLGAGLFACNWFMKYSNKQNASRLKRIRENREEIERQNLEKLRERVRIQELMEEQESTQTKKPVRKSPTKKPNQDTE